MKIEHPPLVENGFKEISLLQLYNYFLEPFKEKEHRRNLIDKFKGYIEEFSSLKISAELWIDGSFVTKKEDPEDIDLLFLFKKQDIDYLSVQNQFLFTRLFLDRDYVKLKYNCDVYFTDRNSQEEIERWISIFGFDSSKLNSKGIFKIILNFKENDFIF